MTFTAPLGLLALLAVPAVLALHLLRRRPVERRVSALFLFPGGTSSTAGRKRSPLVRSASLFLELAAALLLALLCAGFSFGGGSTAAHLVVVLDDSASMSAGGTDASSSAVGAGGVAVTVAQRAQAAVRDAVAALPRDARVTLIASGARPEVMLGPAAPKALLDSGLQRHVPQQPHHDLWPALQLGLEIAAPGDPLLLVTDSPDVAAPPRYRVVAVGAAQANVWIARARRVRRGGGSGDLVLLDLQAAVPRAAGGAEPRAAEGADPRAAAGAAEPLRRALTVQLEGAPPVVARQDDALVVPGATTRVTIPLPAAATGAVTVRLSHDALALDDAVTLLPEPRRIVRIDSRLDETASRALQLDRLLAALPDVAAASAEEPGQLALVAGEDTVPAVVTEVALSAASASAVAAPAGGAAAPGTDAVAEVEGWRGPFLLEHAEPLLDGLSFDGVVWAARATDAPGRSLITAAGRVLMADTWRAGTRRVVLNLVPEHGSVAASPDWPILMHNLVEDARRRLPGAVAANVHVGDDLIWRRAAGAPLRDAQIVDPDGRPWALGPVHEIVWPVRRAGIHRLVERGEEVARWSAAFADARESDLGDRGSGERRADAGAVPVAASGVQLAAGAAEQRLLALLVLLCAIADWLVLRGAPAWRRSGA